MTGHGHTLGLPTGPPALAIPAPRGAAEPTRCRDRGEAAARQTRSVRDEPGWVSLVEAVDQTVAGLVAALEHRLCHTDAATATWLRRQLRRARQLEATTAAAAAAAHHTRSLGEDRAR